MANDRNAPENFELQQPREGVPPAGVIDELRRLRRGATEAVYSYSSAIEAQAEKHGIKRGALRRFITALERDKTKDAQQEASDLERLIEALL